jgi:hypothetical protein
MLTLVEVLAGILITEWTFIFFARRVFSRYINEWYTNFGIFALLSDVSSIFIGIMIASYFYRGKSLLVLIGVAVLVQWIHDVLFYVGLIQPSLNGRNAIIDLLKPYGSDAGVLALIGDSWMMIGSLLFAKAVSYLPFEGQIFTLAVSGYMLPYAIYQKPTVDTE